MILQNNQKQRLREGLGDAFSLSDLEILVSDFLGQDMEDIVVDGPKKTRIHKLLGWTEHRGNTIQLLDGALKRRPKNGSLLLLAEELGMSSASTVDGPMFIDIAEVSKGAGNWAKPDTVPPSLIAAKDKDESPKRQLQRVVQELGSWINPKLFGENLSLMEGRVCRVVVGSTGGTGFLVAPDLVMTNYHVIAPILKNKFSVQDSYCLFDYHELADGTELPGERVRFATEWLQAKSPASASDNIVNGPDPKDNECDFAILKLVESIGSRPIGPPTADANAEDRGWVTIGDPPPPGQAGAEVLLLQHPRKKHMRLTFGRVLGFNEKGNRLRHDANTLVGSSGSPCFNADLELIALHHAGDPDFDPEHRPEYNQAVPLAPILTELKGNDGLEQFWVSGAGG